MNNSKKNLNYYGKRIAPVLAIIVSCVSLVISAFYFKLNENPNVWMLIILALIDCLIISCSYVFFFVGSSQNKLKTLSEVKDLPRDYIAKTSNPIVICKNGTIWWQNDSFTAVSNGEDVTGRTFENEFKLPLNKIGSKEQIFSAVKYNDVLYYVTKTTTKANESEYQTICFENKQDYFDLKKESTENEAFVMRIEADSFDEFNQTNGENTRMLSVKLSELLLKWTAENGGAIKEFKNDKYIAFFSKKAIDGFIQNKFDILDNVRRLGSGENVPVTISIGVGLIKGTLSEKDQYANEAFTLAIQRGGDQAVIKSERGLEYYGGATISVQKKNLVRSRLIANQLKEHIKASSNVIIQGHKIPDFDAIGACIGVAAICNDLGVPFHIVTNKQSVNFGLCKDVIAKIPWIDMEKSFLSAGNASEFLTSETLCVFVDFTNIRLAECPELIDMSERTVYIDHHRVNGEYITQPLLAYIETSASSTCELVSEVLEHTLSSRLGDNVANLIYAGIEVDTNHFEKNTGVKTLTTSIYLRNQGANPQLTAPLFKTTEEDYIDDSRYGLNTEIYHGDIAVTFNETTKNPITAARAADRLLQIRNIKASFAICPLENGFSSISARSTSEINVSIILEKLGGGGHFDSAGAQVNCSVKEAKKLLLDSVDGYLENEKTKREENIK